MSEDGFPPPVTPRRKRSVRISTGARKPPPPTANPYPDLEAVESGDSGEEENLDKYETDFIDDGDDVDHDNGTPIPWSGTPSPTPAKASGKASRAGRTLVVDPTPNSPMTTRSRSKNPTAPASKSLSTSVPGPTSLNTSGYQGQFMLFMNYKKSTPKQVCFSASLAAVEGGVKPKVKGAPSESSALASGTSQIGAAIPKLPPPTWTTRSTTDLAGSNTTPNRMNQAVPSATNSSEDADITSVKAGVKRPLEESTPFFLVHKDNAAASDSEMAVDVDQVSRPTKGARAVAKNVRQSVSNRQGEVFNSCLIANHSAVGGSKLPEVPSVEFARLKETSPEKKPKKEEIVVHTVDVKAVKELPEVCEVTNVELQDPMMQSIYALDLPNLRRGQVTTWSSNEGPGMFILSEYPVINPELPIESAVHLETGSRILTYLVGQYGSYPLGEGPLYVCLVNTTRSSLRDISTVYGGSNGGAPLLKYILGVHLSQDFDRITGLCGMVFNLELMHVQLNMSALTFGTKGIPLDKYGFDASVDIDNLRDILPMYKGEIPANSCTAVGYTISNFVKASGRSEEQHLSFNIQWVVVLGEPE
ncbi:hypothetical protein B0H14DRAFT_2635895 [Mycena olivaceomarginata]|nr:hypothetical protein B0H14DRAFT_2635895 [Mycena olivaceomarginata]